ncbi:Flagellar motor switch protein FliN [Candidatus Trichorickettsia mobilis]|jgi:flagellar motor switch protein FliN/FliY|uniref:Flagellar motor switch protein FliN n=1 Tax=Candidatus Trichorickettsia mobilis TaxID=1346319 RepID=A0ABZ0UUV4_9RICK|nr:flagellar motor switch protein FliN [Candidatus Trichorickettsia mobilis]WPY00955.1 Flagellar motor switch protein FliN [Candidatus Trichorickettsia mobilis]
MTKDNNNVDQELTLEALYDVPVQVSVVLGRTTMQLSHILKLGRGAVIELERGVGEPIDVYVNNKIVAKGEIVVVDSKIGVTLTEVVASDKER